MSNTEYLLMDDKAPCVTVFRMEAHGKGLFTWLSDIISYPEKYDNHEALRRERIKIHCLKVDLFDAISCPNRDYELRRALKVEPTVDVRFFLKSFPELKFAFAGENFKRIFKGHKEAVTFLQSIGLKTFRVDIQQELVYIGGKSYRGFTQALYDPANIKKQEEIDTIKFLF